MRPETQPRTLKEMSLDMRLMFGFHICMMALMFAHLALHAGFRFELITVCSAGAVIIFLSHRNRARRNWHWFGTNWKNIVGALVSLLLGFYFLGSILPGHRISNPAIFPWLCAGGGILSFCVLSALDLVQYSEASFEQHCGDNRPPEPVPAAPPKPRIPRWKRILATTFQLYFLAVWIAGVGFFWKFNSAMSHGSPQPTATQTERLTDHGYTVYITREDRQQVNLLLKAMTLGIPSAFLIGGILHFAGVARIFPNRRNRGINS